MIHEWRIDILGEDSAAVEESGNLRHVPRWLLPPDARENDIVNILITDGPDARRIEMRIDAAATRDALAASKRQITATPPQNDPGGPIRL